MVGEGRLLEQARAELSDAGLLDRAWLPGPRDDVPDILRMLDVFVLPSLAEGISNTLLEAMASGRPAVATAVGGNVELVVDGGTGTVVPPSDPLAMAEALARYAQDADLVRGHGANARRRVEEHFSLDMMVGRYAALYDGFFPDSDH